MLQIAGQTAGLNGLKFFVDTHGWPRVHWAKKNDFFSQFFFSKFFFSLATSGSSANYYYYKKLTPLDSIIFRKM